jgi:3-oxoacyl-[acyl-carrier-protein] synthase-3
MLYVNEIDYFVPENKVPLMQLTDRYQLSPVEMSVFNRLYGLDKVPISDVTIFQMIRQVVGELLKKSAVERAQIKYLVYTHTAQEYDGFFATVLKRVCASLGLSQARCFGMTTNNCASTVSALDVLARVLNNSDEPQSAVLVTADVAFTPILQVIPNSSVTGDACVACLLSNHSDKGGRLLSLAVDTHGEHAKCQWQEASEMKRFEDLYSARLTGVMQQALTEADCEWSDVATVIPHNVNVYSWKKVATELGLDMQKIYLDQVPEIAHCFGADLFLNLAKATEQGRVKTGDRVMIATVGLGAVFAAAVLQF